MSKLSFRARALDASKPMPIYLSEELPDLPEYLSINRSVPQMPSGMEKEEESERHLQEAISAGTVIPTPEVFCIADLGHTDRLDLLYPAKHKVPKQYVHYQSYAFDSDVPEYDMDSEDERWVNAQTKKMDVPLSVNQFEEMMDRLEKGSGQQVVTLKEAKMLVQEDDDLIVAVYDYWLNKRLKMQYPLIPAVKTEKSLGGGGGGGALHSANPYVAFRRRLEKMQTRKNRKNDEVSYEKMLKLRRNLSRAVTILEMMKRREKMKKEHLHLTVEIFEKRYSVGDYSGQLLSEAASSQKTTASHQLYRGGIAQQLNNNNSHHLLHRPSFAPSPLHPSQHQQQHVWPSKHKDSTAELKSKRSYKKRKHSRAHLNSTRSAVSGDVVIDTVTSDEEERCRPRPARSRTLPTSHSGAPADQWQDEPEPDGSFTFHRTRGCQYHDVTPWRTADAGESAGLRPDTPPLPAERRFRLGSIRRPQRRTLGLIRQRLGRGGRVIIDRTRADTESELRALGITVPRGHTLSLHDLPHFLPPEQESAPSPVAAAAVDISSCSSRESSPSPPPSHPPASSPHSSAVISSLQQSRQTVSGPAVQQPVVGCSRFQLRPTAAAASDEDAVALLSELLMNGDSGGSSVTARSVVNGAAAVTIGDSGGVAVARSADSGWRPARRLLVNTAQTQCGAPVSVRQQLSSWRQQLSDGNALLADTPPLHSIHTTKPNSHRIREVSAPLKRQLSSVSPRPLLKMKKLVRKDQLSLNAS